MEERRKIEIEGEKRRERKKREGKKKDVVFLAFSHLCFSFILVVKVGE